jgi:hypothetical protein
LKPFKSLGNEIIIPAIVGLEEYHSVAVFNEDYINQFTFTKA